MMNDHGPMNVEMNLEARRTEKGDILPPTDVANDPPGQDKIVVDQPPEAQNLDRQPGQSEAADASDGHASPSPHATITTGLPDISAPSATYTPSSREKILVETASSTIQSAVPTKTTATSPDQAVEATSAASPLTQSHSRPASTRTVAIVVPIVVVVLLLPFLAFWYLSCRRRRRTKRSRSRRHSPPQPVILEKRMQDNLARARNEWSPESLFATKKTTDLASPTRLPLQRAQRPRSAHEFRTSDVPNNSLSGFNFDFSRRATTSSKRSTQRPLPDPSNRRSSNGSWEPTSPYPSRSVAFTPPYLPMGAPIPPSPPPEISQPDEQFPPGSEASLGLLAREKTETSSGRHDISPALSMHEERSPYGASNQPLSDAISEISGLSVDHDLWPPGPHSARHFKSRSEVSAIEPYPSRPDIRPI